MKYIRIILDVALPDDYEERNVDHSLSETMTDLGGEVLDIKEYKESEGIPKTK